MRFFGWGSDRPNHHLDSAFRYNFCLALFVLPYYFLKAPMNRSTLVDPAGNTVGKINVEVSFADIIGHALFWLLLSIITLGLAYFVYWPAVIKRLLNAATIRPL